MAKLIEEVPAALTDSSRACGCAGDRRWQVHSDGFKKQALHDAGVERWHSPRCRASALSCEGAASSAPFVLPGPGLGDASTLSEVEEHPDHEAAKPQPVLCIVRTVKCF